jgi:hypothetical protein
MPYRVGVRPGKPASLVGMLTGGLFVVLGLAVVLPLFGAFGLVWTLFAGLITLYHAYNFFSTRGLPTYQVDVDAPGTSEDFDTRLRKLAQLREDGLITDEEFEQKRAELMRQRW